MKYCHPTQLCSMAKFHGCSHPSQREMGLSFSAVCLSLSWGLPPCPHFLPGLWCPNPATELRCVVLTNPNVGLCVHFPFNGKRDVTDCDERRASEIYNISTGRWTR